MFLQNRAAFDDIVLDATLDAEEELEGAAAVEEEKSDDDEEGEFVYDRALYDADALEDEDIDFDDWFIHYQFVIATHNSSIKLAKATPSVKQAEAKQSTRKIIIQFDELIL